MSKRINRQMQRRRIRRVLNANMEFFTRVGSSRINNLHYGVGLARRDVNRGIDDRSHG